MRVLTIDPRRHTDPDRYRRALRWCVAGVLLGVAATFVGLALAMQNPQGLLVWFTALTLVGPSLVFLSLVGFSTYLERIEAEYGAVYHDEDAPATATAPL